MSARSTLSSRFMVYPYISRRKQAEYEAMEAEKIALTEKMQVIEAKKRRYAERKAAFNLTVEYDILTADEKAFLLENAHKFDNDGAWIGGEMFVAVDTKSKVEQARIRRLEMEEANKQEVLRELEIRRVKRQAVIDMELRKDLQHIWLRCVGVTAAVKYVVISHYLNIFFCVKLTVVGCDRMLIILH